MSGAHTVEVRRGQQARKNLRSAKVRKPLKSAATHGVNFEQIEIPNNKSYHGYNFIKGGPQMRAIQLKTHVFGEVNSTLSE